MQSTSDIRDKMLKLWERFDKGKLTAQEARIHIGFTRSVLDTLKVEIMVAHLAQTSVRPIELDQRKGSQKRLTS